MAMNKNDDEPHGSRPVPDPTALTNELVSRAVASAREILEARMAGMDQFMSQMHDMVKNSNEERNEAMRQIAIHEEKFRGIGVQFAERDTRTEQSSKDNKVAVDAALQAAKEAVGEQNKSSQLAIAKSETSTVKQIDMLGVNIDTMTKALNEKIDDVKSRLQLIEGHTKGSSDNWALIGSLVVAAGALVTMFFALMRGVGQ